MPYKKIWNVSTERYGAFWDPTPLLLHLAKADFGFLQRNVPELRLQLILVCRLLCLYRSSDLANLQRIVSIFLGGDLHKNSKKGPEVPQVGKSCGFVSFSANFPVSFDSGLCGGHTFSWATRGSRTVGFETTLSAFDTGYCGFVDKKCLKSFRHSDKHFWPPFHTGGRSQFYEKSRFILGGGV